MHRPRRHRPTHPRPVRAVLVAVLGLVAQLLTLGPLAVPAAAQSSFAFVGGGFGHGVGMSQYGAKGRADAGQSAADILGFYYPGTSIAATDPAGPRVKLADSSAPEVWSATSGLTAQAADGAPSALAAPGERVAFRLSGSTVYVRRVAPTAGPETVAAVGVPLYVTWTPGQRVDLSSSGKGYTFGRLVIRPKSGTLEVVLDQLSMDQYLYGLAEVPASWPVAALEAQAIAGRSYAAYRLAHPQSSTFDLYASVLDQYYAGADHAAGPSGARWVAAVDATSGRTVTSAGVAIQAFYSSSNGGATEDSGYVWATSYPWFRAAADPHDAAAGNPNASWTETYTGAELGSWLAAAGRGNVGTVTGVSIGGNVGASGRVDKATVTVTGTAGRITVTGNQLRSAVNAKAPASRDLLSTRFTVGGAAAAPAPPASQPPFGQFQFGVPFGTTHVIAAGWVVDGDAPRSPTTVLMTVDGKVVAGGPAAISWPTLSGDPTFGAEHGFFLAAPARNRSHKVCVFAIDQGGDQHRLLGCKDVVRPAAKRRR